MALIINSNLASVSAQRNLNSAQADKALSMDRLSSGKRINSAADDAAGLSITTRMTSQIKGMNMAIRNANDGVSRLQTADGALDTMGTMLLRMKELAVQASNETYSSDDRAKIDAERSMLTAELDRIAKNTQFNGNNAFGDFSLHIGDQSGDKFGFKGTSLGSSSLGRGSNLGDKIGVELDLEKGRLVGSIGENRLQVNDQHIKGVKAGANISDVLSAINTRVDGVEASTLLTMTAKNEGSGVLEGGDFIRLAGFDHDGKEVVFNVRETNSLSNLANKINTETDGLVYASVNDEGKLEITSEKMASLTVSDSSTTGASGLNDGIDDPDIAALIDGLNNYLLSEAETLIEDFYGLIGDGRDINLVVDGASDGPYGVLASVSGNDPLTLTVDMADFTSKNQPDGGNYPLYNDRVITHELVHAVMKTTMDFSAGGQNLPGWFTEGTAELIHGADITRVASAKASGVIDTRAEQAALLKTDPGSPSGPNASDGYTVAYLATKMLQDDIYAATGGAEGVDAVLKEMTDGTTTFEGALQNVSGRLGITWNGNSGAGLSQADFETHYLDNAVAYLNETYVNGTLNTSDGDTGSIAGSDYGNAALTPTSVMPNNPTSGPAKHFNLVVPPEYSGSTLSASARLVLTDEDGDSFDVGATLLGSSSDLAVLGIEEMQSMDEAGIDEEAGASLFEVSFLDVTTARKGITTIDKALDQISDARADIGAAKNRLEFTVSTLTISVENTSAARSRIEDTDYAAEAAHLSRAQVLSQAAQTMLAQANSQPQQVLSLLQ